MHDVAIIGGGVVGCAIARELSKKKVRAVVIEREQDLCCGTTKANSAIIHGGYDAKPGSLKAKLNVLGNKLFDELSEELDFPFKRNGSLVVRTGDQDRAALEELYDQGIKNGVPDLRIIDRSEIERLEPHIADDVVEALFVPTGGIVCPFQLNYALAENAADNGVEFMLSTEVKSVVRSDQGYKLETGAGTIETRTVVNAAGVYADEIHNMVSDKKIHITARRGQYCLLDKSCGDYVSHTIFQLPSAMGKGVLVTPTIHGNLLIGPTAEDVDNKEGVNTTGEGLNSLGVTAALSVKDVPMRQVITSFAGLRAHEDGEDFIIGEAEDAPGFFDAAGIESPGLSSAPAIGELVAGLISDKLSLSDNPDFNGKRKGILNPSDMSMEERNELIKENPAYGQIICRCESISEGEILDAIHRTLGARDLDGVKRRTRAGMGRCQAGFCSPRVMEILEREVPMSAFDVTKNGPDAKIVFGYNKRI